MSSFLCFLLFSCTGSAPAEVTAKAELEYGNVLYSYYQEDYDQALLDVSVDLEEGVPEDLITRYQLAEGSFAFKNRMFGYAQDRFANVAQQELTELDRMRLSFHLSREYFRTGDWARLAQELEQIDLGTRSFFGRQKYHPEVEYMRAEHALQSGDLDLAQEYLVNVADTSAYKMYGLFNLGAAQRAAGAAESAQKSFTAVAKLKPRDAEMLDLQQRAVLALAFLQRENGHADQAERLLGKLPEQGRYRDLGLASFGSLAMEQGNYELAARVWLNLQTDAIWSPSTATAHLGFPLSLEHMDRGDLALTHYRAAEARFSARAAKLDDLSVAAQNPEWVRELLEVFAAEQADPQRMRDWQEQLGHTDWLEWLSAESIDSLIVQWRELRSTQRYLADLPRDLATLELLTAEQNRRAGAVNKSLVEDGLLDRHAQIEARTREKLVRWERLSEQAVVPSFEWMLSFSDAPERKRLDRLRGMYEFVASKSATGLLDEDAAKQWTQRLDRLRGLLFWEIAQQHPVRLRDMRRAIRGVEAFSDDMLAQTERLQSAQGTLSVGIVADYSALRSRTALLAEKVERALQGREYQIAQELRRGMQRESLQVEEYLLTARIAIARTLDQYASVSGADQQ